jgi:ssRNA-specific RNase YbeY (16S rRNA maturation enzyme)
MISGVMKAEKCAVKELHINFINNRKIKEVNNLYLKHKYSTDVITFPYSDNKKAIDGEILFDRRKGKCKNV